jgi:hypothetical protein
LVCLSEQEASAATTMFVDMFAVNTTLTAVRLSQNPQSEHDLINERRLEPWTKRKKRLGKVLVGVQQLLFTNNHNHNNISDGLWGKILNGVTEDVDRERSALFLLIRNATLGQAARPLHAMVVEAMGEVM